MVGPAWLCFILEFVNRAEFKDEDALLLMFKHGSLFSTSFMIFRVRYTHRSIGALSGMGQMSFTESKLFDI